MPDEYPGNEVEEMICKGCVTRLPFLLAYTLENPTDEQLGTDGCILESRKEIMKQEPYTLYFHSGKEFRDSLCKCAECQVS